MTGSTASAPHSQATLSARGLHVSLGGQPILRDVGLQVGRGELVAVIGPNGSGKTTLLRTLAGVLTPESGNVDVGSDPLAQLARREIARRLAYLPQETFTSFSIRVRDLVELGRYAHVGALRALGTGDRAAVEEAMRDADVADLAERVVPTLSGGERRRAYLARVIAQQAETLVLDEPLSALDIGHAVSVLRLLRTLADRDKSVLFSLHELSLAVRGVDRLVLLDKGKVAAEGAPRDVLVSQACRDAFGVRLAIVETPGGPPTVSPL